MERHGLDTPPYEEFDGCPNCYGVWIFEPIECDGCGEFITGQYAKLEDGSRYCEECFTLCDANDFV